MTRVLKTRASLEYEFNEKDRMVAWTAVNFWRQFSSSLMKPLRQELRHGWQWLYFQGVFDDDDDDDDDDNGDDDVDMIEKVPGSYSTLTPSSKDRLQVAVYGLRL